jgi:hypothetical protein
MAMEVMVPVCELAVIMEAMEVMVRVCELAVIMEVMEVMDQVCELAVVMVQACELTVVMVLEQRRFLACSRLQLQLLWSNADVGDQQAIAWFHRCCCCCCC